MAAIAQEIISGSAVAFGSRAVLIQGASGSGKSSLALELISRGALLVSDDKVMARRMDASVELLALTQIAGMIEARCIGILRLAYRERATLTLIVDMDTQEKERLPDRQAEILGMEFPLILGAERRGLAAALAVMLTNGEQLV